MVGTFYVLTTMAAMFYLHDRCDVESFTLMIRIYFLSSRTIYHPKKRMFLDLFIQHLVDIGVPIQSFKEVCRKQFLSQFPLLYCHRCPCSFYLVHYTFSLSLFAAF